MSKSYYLLVQSSFMCTLLFANPSDTHREEEEKKKIEASNETVILQEEAWLFSSVGCPACWRKLGHHRIAQVGEGH